MRLVPRGCAGPDRAACRQARTPSIMAETTTRWCASPMPLQSAPRPPCRPCADPSPLHPLQRLDLLHDLQPILQPPSSLDRGGQRFHTRPRPRRGPALRRAFGATALRHIGLQKLALGAAGEAAASCIPTRRPCPARRRAKPRLRAPAQAVSLIMAVQPLASGGGHVGQGRRPRSPRPSTTLAVGGQRRAVIRRPPPNAAAPRPCSGLPRLLVAASPARSASSPPSARATRLWHQGVEGRLQRGLSGAGSVPA